MRDDEDQADGRVHTVDTVPPPAGEDDVYGAKTQIGGLTPEALAMLRQVRDERPQAGSTLDDLDVSVFEEDAAARNDGPAPVARIIPAAGRPASTKPLDVTPKARPVMPGALPVALKKARASSAPQVGSVEIKPDSSDVKRAAREETPPVPPVFIPKAPLAPRELAPLLDDDEPDPEPEPASYVSVFAPISGDVAGPETQPSARKRAAPRSRTWTVLVALIVIAVAVAIVGQAGWLPAVHVAPRAPAATPP